MQNFYSKLFLATIFAAASWAQAPAGASAPAAARVASGTLHGTIKDNTGGIIPGATVTLTASDGTTLSASTGADGTYSLRRVPAGTYSVVASYKNMQQKGAALASVVAGQAAIADITMLVSEQKQEITVSDTVNNQVSTEAANNGSALVLHQEDLDALPDDPDDLQADLQALAGPSAGPGGAQIYIDGFTGGRLPPKASIREIRINSNPFSAEFDKLGFGRIQIFTKPGTDRFHGQGYYNISDGIWNSRNPFLTTSPPFRTQLFGGNISGPLGKHASFFIDTERRNIDDNGIITATVPTSGFLGSQSYQNFYSTPQRRTTVSPRLDYQLGTNNTLSFRYEYTDNYHQLSHIGAFDLPSLTLGNYTFPSNGDSSSDTQQEFQVVETAVVNPHIVNESHLEFSRENELTTSLSTAPTLDVSQSFVAGGSGFSSPSVPNSATKSTYLEFQNYTSITWGAHVTKFGARMRASWVNDRSPQNFNGTYAFLGGTFPVLGANLAATGETSRITSIQQFLLTEQLLNAGYSSAQVTQLGYGPSKFTINQGNPSISLNQIDVGPFLQDDWRIRPNLTLSFGARYEAQTNIGDYGDVAPRFGFAWAPGGGAPTGMQRPKTVVRGGWGIFYERFSIDNVLNAYRYGRNGGSQLTYTVDNPTSYSGAFNTTPPLSELTQLNTSQFYQIDPNLKAPRMMQAVVGIDRQLLSHTTLSLNVVDSRGVHELLTADINAPVPVLGDLPPGTSTLAGGSRGVIDSNSAGVRPFGNVGDIYDYQSTGIFKQLQLMANLNSQIGKRVTLFTRYSYQQSHSTADGLGTMPSNPYDIAANYGRSQLDVHHQFFLGGSISAPWGLRFSPFIVAHSGTPFNITTGTDLYLQGQVAPTARPEPVAAGTPGAVNSPLGWLNPYPVVGAPLLERNAATGPGFLGVNLRVSKTFGFGTTKFEGPSGGARAGGGGGRGPGGPGGRGPGGFFGGPGESTEHRYNLTASLNARNILNHENLNTPNGALTSPYFFQSTGITGGFGAEATASNQRRLDIQLRFTF